jgi:hypothetical protein
MAYILGRLGVEVAAPEDVEEVLRRCHAVMRAEERLLTDDDIRGIASGTAAARAASS